MSTKIPLKWICHEILTFIYLKSTKSLQMDMNIRLGGHKSKQHGSGQHESLPVLEEMRLMCAGYCYVCVTTSQPCEQQFHANNCTP